MTTQGAGKRSGESPGIAGGLTLLVFMAVLAIGLLAATGASIAFAAGAPAAVTGSPPAAPLALPGGAAASSTASAPDCPRCRGWIVAGRPGPATARIARRHGARTVSAKLGAYRVPRGQAGRFARALRRAGRLAYAEPDLPIRPAGYPADLLAGAQDWLGQIVNPADTTPPGIDGSSPVIGLVEQGIDPSHPDLIESGLTGGKPTGDVTLDSHGTSVAGIIGSPGEGKGIRGVWPGARMQHFPSGSTCSSSASAVIAAVNAGVAVINMSYTFAPSGCYTHYLATEYAAGHDVVAVAAAGNDAARGNPRLGPGIHPHVLSVAAVDADRAVAAFSTFNSAVDLSAPGVEVLAPVVRAEAASDKAAKLSYEWAGESGTSFSAPMVAAAAAWIRQARPGLSAAQTARVLTASATDLGVPGRDPHYGDGLLDIEAALMAPRPYDDALEPNEDIHLLKKSDLHPRAKYLWKPHGRRTVRLRATLARTKDPADVYRVRIPARKRILIIAAQLEGSVRITALKPSTRSLRNTRRKVIVSSDRPFPHTEGIKVRNLRRKPANIWLAVTPSPRDRIEYSAYRLTIRRSH